METTAQALTTAFERLHKWMVKDDSKWGSYDDAGNKSVCQTMQFASNSLLGLAMEEAEQGPKTHPSLGKRVVIIEDAVTRFRMAVANCPDSGLDDTDVRDQVYGYLVHVLTASGVSEHLARGIVSSMPISGHS
jgi:hypothetical protein